MAHSSILIWPLLIISCSCMHLVSCQADLTQIKHSTNKNDGSITFLVVGDWGRRGYFNQTRVATQMGSIGKKLGIDFVISTGDNFYIKGLKGIRDSAFRSSFTNVYTARSLQMPWYIGNHDYLGNTAAQLSQDLRKLDKRWHCWRNFVLGAGIVDIIFIDTTPFVGKYFENPKGQWFDWRGVLPRHEYLSTLRKNLDLALETSKTLWKIVVGHHTIRSIGHHGDTQEIVDQILPILEAHNVDMYINGHDHCLEHLSDKQSSMQFFTSGGGSKAWKNDIHYGVHNDSTHFYYDGQGFMSVKLKQDMGKIVFYDIFGKPLHRIELKPWGNADKDSSLSRKPR